MTRHHPVLHPFGWGSLVGGIIAATIGQLSGTELGGLAWTYGVLVVMAAAYLLIGMRVYAALQARQTSAPTAKESTAPRQPEASRV